MNLVVNLIGLTLTKRPSVRTTSIGDKMRSFKAPDGNVYLGIRSVVYDSWIMWNDVLPDPQDEQPLMTKDIYENITELGLRIHKLHQSMPNYKQMTESPFNFVLWWDPDDDDDDWSRGKVCRFMINDYSAEDILFYSKSKKGNKLLIKPMTSRLVEARIIPKP